MPESPASPALREIVGVADLASAELDAMETKLVTRVHLQLPWAILPRWWRSTAGYVRIGIQELVVNHICVNEIQCMHDMQYSTAMLVAAVITIRYSGVTRYLRPVGQGPILSAECLRWLAYAM